MIMNKQEFLTCAGLEMQTLDLWLEQRWLIPDQTFGGLNFSDVDLARARLIQDLKTGFGVNNEGIDVTDPYRALQPEIRKQHNHVVSFCSG